jgi:hypothetical protein
VGSDADTQQQGAVSIDDASAPSGGWQPPSPDPDPAASVPHGSGTASHPPGSSMPEGGIPLTERPEALVGAAFAGGLVAAMILRRLGR